MIEEGFCQICLTKLRMDPEDEELLLRTTVTAEAGVHPR
ncbi:hypothetical protein SXIM_18810 [Streptomyces xiamenensis]|uniref:Uncharacterized protein n=1 Tax=Streptomyces xiamenensis TaxID=408015 RepID=A0A0F7FU18_9ACTN|nr:hypothetical protein SXIM_18810 [Streptomyces xiamenensis]